MGGLPRALELTLEALSVRVVHGGINRINRFVFESAREVLAEELDEARADIVIAGHSGIPFIHEGKRGVWFNPGVIGLPANDGTRDGWYGLISRDKGEIVLSTHRLAYDAQSEAAAMRGLGHVHDYARTLLTGLWPSLDVLPPKERAASGRRLCPRTLRLTTLAGASQAHQRAVMGRA